jgi:hypothetical protein
MRLYALLAGANPGEFAIPFETRSEQLISDEQ